ncbi:hypothetical protein [Burkholderia sp. BCC1047]|uniref:hypothetical protein n=1 Tax=Burkholderia sp. BCC1047 TaxID=2676299 RepID=UPI00158AED71|nr:hypothetical protein [Burkholderia sp. BCC1047]
MKALLARIFGHRAEQAPAAEVAPRKPAGKRRYGKSKPRHPAPRGAYKADWNEPILQGDRR